MEVLDVIEKGRALLGVIFVACLVGVYVVENHVGIRTKGKDVGLDATLVERRMGGEMMRSQGVVIEKCDCFFCDEGGVTVLVCLEVKVVVIWMGCVCEVWVCFLKGDDV